MGERTWSWAVLEAAGYGYEILGNREVCEAGRYPLGTFDEYTPGRNRSAGACA